jgi:hypothetical protein
MIERGARVLAENYLALLAMEERQLLRKVSVAVLEAALKPHQ